MAQLMSTTKPRGGVYVVRLDLGEPSTIQVGRFGQFNFAPGTYLYIGRHKSALDARVERHLGIRPMDSMFWNVDYLSAHPAVVAVGAVLLRGPPELECALVEQLQVQLHLAAPIKRFGMRDCRAGCAAHLLYSRRPISLRRLDRALGGGTERRRAQ